MDPGGVIFVWVWVCEGWAVCIRKCVCMSVCACVLVRACVCALSHDDYISAGPCAVDWDMYSFNK